MKRRSQAVGFTLLETALALVIMALVVSAMIYPLRAQVETHNVYRWAAKLLEQAARLEPS